MSRPTAAARRHTVAVSLALAALTCGLPPAPTAEAAGASLVPSAARASETPLPSKSEWLADVNRAMRGSRIALHARTGDSAVGRRLAVNLDIDNTSLASHYEWGAPVPVVLRFARYARRHGVLLLFNTGRQRGDGRLLRAERQLTAAGYRVTAVCGRRAGEALAEGKQRCRRQFVRRGYTLIANVGNRSTDFVGGHYERAYRLPNYGNRLA
ncbi:MAG TPA: HAD family acid phosphatase [Nocardioidaceae bacterium]|nr:HAD family acid phosphatase [Nocardioidaceae bacterium]